MTDTTNHADVIRETLHLWVEFPATRDAALAALDALTREAAMLRDARDNWKGRHDILDREGFKVSRELDAARATIAAQSERIAKLEGALGNIIKHHDMIAGPGMTAHSTVCTIARAALAPKEQQK